MWLSTRRRFAVVLVRGMTTWWLTSDPHRVRLHHRASRPQFTTHTPHAPRSSARSSAATMLSALKSARLPSFGPQSPSRMARRASASRHGNLVRPKRCERRAVRWDRPASTRGSREACAKKLFDQRERGARGSRRLRCSSAGASDGGRPKMRPPKMRPARRRAQNPDATLPSSHQSVLSICKHGFRGDQSVGNTSKGSKPSRS